MRYSYSDNATSRYTPILTPDGLVSLHSSVTGKPMLPRIDFSHEVGFAFGSISEVEAVYTSQLKGRDEMFFVWIVVPERDHGVYRRIFSKQQHVIDEHAPLRFDFTIMPSRGKDPAKLVTDPCARLVYLRS